MGFGTDPFAEMNRLFDQTRRSMWRDSMLPAGGRVARAETEFDSNLDVETTGEGYVVMADLPGFEREDLDLQFADGVLSITGEIDVTEDDEGSWRRRSRSVHEQLALPKPVVTEEISAVYHNGVLEIHLPTEEDLETDAHRIDID